MTRLTLWLGFLSAALWGLHHAALTPSDPLRAPFEVVRVTGLALGWWLAVTTVLGVFAHVLRWRPAMRVTDALSAPFVRRLVSRAAGVALAASLISPAAAFAGAPAKSPPPVMHLLETAPPASTPAPVALQPAAPSPSRTEYTVKPGDCLWHIAHRVLSDRLGRPPSDAEVVPFWKALLAANTDRVRDPSLIYVDQVLRLP